MGILNVTPDSFSDGGKHQHVDEALAHAHSMIQAGATIIDVGGESTRPGSSPVDPLTEIQRTSLIIRLIRESWNGLISIDTSKASVAESALTAGADIVNDVSGLLADPAMASLCAHWHCGIVVMHMQGTPQSMQTAPTYTHVVQDVQQFFLNRYRDLTDFGIHPECLCFDPGIGFGKSASHNLSLIQHLPSLAPEQRPILLGISRKSFISHLLEQPDLSLRDWPTVAITALARHSGILLHRVHDVTPNLHALRMSEAILSAP